MPIQYKESIRFRSSRGGALVCPGVEGQARNPIVHLKRGSVRGPVDQIRYGVDVRGQESLAKERTDSAKIPATHIRVLSDGVIGKPCHDAGVGARHHFFLVVGFVFIREYCSFPGENLFFSCFFCARRIEKDLSLMSRSRQEPQGRSGPAIVDSAQEICRATTFLQLTKWTRSKAKARGYRTLRRISSAMAVI
jgi:hypothetical protein